MKSALYDLISHIKANPGFYDRRKIHSDINIVLLAVISGYSDVLKVVLNTFGYEENLYTTRFKPLEFALKRSNIQILDVFASCLKNEKLENYDDDLFFKMLSCPSVKLK